MSIYIYKYIFTCICHIDWDREPVRHGVIASNTPVTSACKYKRMCRQVKDTVTIYSRLALMYRSHDVSKSLFVRCSIAIEIRVLIVILTHASVLE